MEFLCKEGYLALGIQDCDLDGIEHLFEFESFESNPPGENIVQTFPSRDLETMIFSQLMNENAFQEGYPKEFELCVSKATKLAYLGIGLRIFNLNSRIDALGLRRFSEKKKKDNFRCNQLLVGKVDFMRLSSFKPTHCVPYNSFSSWVSKHGDICSIR